MSDAPVNRERLLGIVAGVALGLLLADWLVFTPVWQAWRSRSAEVTRLQAEVTRARNLVDQEARWQKWGQETRTRLLASAPAEAENQLINQVDAWARETGLQVTALRPDWQPSSGTGEAVIQLQVSAVGRLETVVRMLHRIDIAPLAVAVEQLELTPSPADNATLGLELRLSALCQSPGAPPAPVPVAAAPAPVVPRSAVAPATSSAPTGSKQP